MEEQNTVKTPRYFDAVRYLVLKKMVGKNEILLAIQDYMEGKIRPADVQAKYGITKWNFKKQAKTYIGRARNSIFAQIIATKAIPIILEVVPTVLENHHNHKSGTRVCKLCGKELFNDADIHVSVKHKKELEKYTEKVISLIKNGNKKIT